MIENEALHKEIDLIQTCITRMAGNSFLLKGWMLTVVAAVWAFTISANSTITVCAALLIIILAFWHLDAFFLRTEKMYRKMYEWVLIERKKDNEAFLYDLNPHRFDAEVGPHFKVMFSLTLRYFYGIPFLLIMAILIWQVAMLVISNQCTCDTEACYVVWMRCK